jgi:hypothetical protein
VSSAPDRWCYRPDVAKDRPFVLQALINRILAFAFVALILGKLFFRPQLKALGRWLDGVVNAMLIAIVLAYAVQLGILLTR